MKKYVRLYPTPDGITHLEEVEIPFYLDVMLGEMVVARQSKPMKTGESFFISGSKDGGWHCAPRRQFLIFLDGEMEMEVGDGERRKFLPGDVLLVEDTFGEGHNSFTKNWLALVIPWEKV